jgi:cobaltochelatase CobT
MTGAPNVIRRKLERALSAKMNRGWEGGREQGKLDTKRLVSAFNGKTDVYKERDPVPEIDTATTILIDCSGSMSGSKIQLANEIAIALAEALERTTVSYEILGFTDRFSGWQRFYREKVKGRKESFSRVEGLLHYVFKDYNESLLRAKPALGGIDCYAERRENVDGEAVQWASRRLLKRHEKRKVMLVLSDGLPAFTCSRAGGYEDYDLMGAQRHCRYAVDEAIKSGIDMIGIGIKDSSVKKFYPDHVVVRNLDDLQKTVISKLAKALLGERYEVDNSELMKVRDAVA